jgi:hypothetical protein
MTDDRCPGRVWPKHRPGMAADGSPMYGTMACRRPTAAAAGEVGVVMIDADDAKPPGRKRG